VGWYRTETGIRIDPADQPFDERQTPAVLYPDPNKDPNSESDAPVQAIWSKFEESLARATHVLVLGHSLHDRPLSNLIRARLQSGHVRVAVTYCGDTEEESAPMKKQLEAVGLGGDQEVSLIGLRFGPDGVFSDVERWMAGATIRPVVKLSSA